jgi:hypothetical protein
VARQVFKPPFLTLKKAALKKIKENDEFKVLEIFYNYK